MTFDTTWEVGPGGLGGGGGDAFWGWVL
ncbi:hypothetical protein M3J09_012683 [Ascochyta lentis]